MFVGGPRTTTAGPSRSRPRPRQPRHLVVIWTPPLLLLGVLCRLRGLWVLPPTAARHHLVAHGRCRSPTTVSRSTSTTTPSCGE